MTSLTNDPLPQDWKDWVDSLPESGRQYVLDHYTKMLEQKKKEMDEEFKEEACEIMREGHKEAMEELFDDWEFEPTLGDLARRCPPMQKEVNGIVLYRYFTDEEEKKVHHTGRSIRLPVRWGWGPDGVVYETYTISEKDWKAGVRWTLRRVWDYASRVYSKNRMRAVKEMGDHQFFEGIAADGTVYVGS